MLRGTYSPRLAHSRACRVTRSCSRDSTSVYTDCVAPSALTSAVAVGCSFDACTGHKSKCLSIARTAVLHSLSPLAGRDRECVARPAEFRASCRFAIVPSSQHKQRRCWTREAPGMVSLRESRSAASSRGLSPSGVCSRFLCPRFNHGSTFSSCAGRAAAGQPAPHVARLESVHRLGAVPPRGQFLGRARGA